jgi:hypothetical protein
MTRNSPAVFQSPFGAEAALIRKAFQRRFYARLILDGFEVARRHLILTGIFLHFYGHIL